MTNNFYEWLELSVERFESDPANLEPILEKKIIEWKFSKSVQLQDRAFMYGGKIKKAIYDPQLWEHFYNEYRAKVVERVSLVVIFLSDDDEIEFKQVQEISNKFEVSIDFVKEIIAEKNIVILDLSNYSIHSIEPTQNVIQQLNSIQAIIEKLGYKDLFDFICKDIFIEITLNTIENKIIIDVLSDIKKRWARVSHHGMDINKKSNIDRICSGMIAFLKKYDISEYSKYLIYRNINITLAEITMVTKQFDINHINQKAYKLLLEKIENCVGNKQKAEKIILSFCEESNINVIM